MASFLKKAASVAMAPATGGLSLLGLSGSPKDLLFGKETGTQFAPISSIPVDAETKAVQDRARSLQTKVMSGMESQLGEDVTGLARAQVGREQQAIQSGLNETRRKIQELMARRGLSNTSIGLGQQVGAEREAAKQSASLMASIPERIQQLKTERLQNALTTSGSVMGQPGLQPTLAQGTPSQRKGGLLSPLMTIGGAGLGAFFGGPAGAAAGMQTGRGVGDAAQGIWG